MDAISQTPGNPLDTDLASSQRSAPDQRLRIAVLNRQFSATGGGAERYSIALVEQLAQRHEMHVFAQHIEHDWPGVTYHKVSKPLTRPRWLNQLWYATATWWATRRGFDVVHSHENTWHGNVQTMHVPPVRYNLFHGKSGAAFVLTWFKVLFSLRLWVYLWLEGQRLSIASSRSIVITSDSLKRQTVAVYPACGAVLQIIPPGVDRVAGVASAMRQLAARQRLGLPVEGRCILFVGNDYRKKGLATLIRALTQLPVDCYVAVVGNTKQIPQFKTLVESESLRGRIYFLGLCKDMDELYASADCLAHPTLEDTFAMVVLEAMAHGLPVTVSVEKYCGIAGLLKHEDNALLLDDPTDAEVLAKAIARLLDDAVLRNRLIRHGLAFANQHSWTTVKNDYDRIYRAIALKTSTPE